MMIDNVEKSLALVEQMRVALPLHAFTSKELRKTLQQNFPPECSIAEVRYLGDEGGIMCHLNFGFSDSKEVHIVSITHLRFDRAHPLAREIEGYSKHRIKRLKKLT
jgi:hypothetical protein